MSVEQITPSSETKACRYCAETIRAEAIRCRYCHANLVPQRNAGLAAVLSLVIPGAGQIYNGRILAGLAAMLVVLGSAVDVRVNDRGAGEIVTMLTGTAVGCVVLIW